VCLLIFLVVKWSQNCEVHAKKKGKIFKTLENKMILVNVKEKIQKC
jgi:hypothetical protein